MTTFTPYDAPQFSLPDETNTTRSLKSYQGKWLVLYFYPKDDTPGCTIEACSLRDAGDEIAALGAEILGVSKDTIASHGAFRSSHRLSFHLLADESGKVIDEYGAWGKKQFGREGILRKTFIINPDGQVVKVFGRVTPLGHGDQVVQFLRQLQANS